jgi:hypothetical protein
VVSWRIEWEVHGIVLSSKTGTQRGVNMVEPRHNIASISTKPSSIGTLAGVLDVCECRKQHKWITNGQTASIMVQKNTMAN